MSFTFDIKTKSGNGLPVTTLADAIREHGLELVESVTWIRNGHNKTDGHYVLYQVTAHESTDKSREVSMGEAQLNRIGFYRKRRYHHDPTKVRIYKGNRKSRRLDTRPVDYTRDYSLDRPTL